MSLSPCVECFRHLRDDDGPTCRFCGAPRSGSPSVQKAGSRVRVSRGVAAVAALSTAVAIGACHNEQVAAPVYGGPPPNEPVPAAADAGEVPAPPTSASGAKPPVPTPNIDRQAPVYGAPPTGASSSAPKKVP